MNKCRILLMALAIAAAGPSMAQEDISGTWAGMLPAGPDTTLEIHFVLEREGDGYSAVLTSPDQGGIQDLPATSTSFEGNELVLTVDALAGRYEGTFEDGVFRGNWYQQDQEIPLDLERYVERALSDAAKDRLRGSWVGELTMQGLTLAIVFRFENDEAGEFVGYLDSPDQGATDIPLANIELENGELSFAVPQVAGQYTATLDGDGMSGTWSQVGQPMALDMTRGEYVQRGLELSQEAIDRLEGSWVGRLETPAGASLAIVFRFEPTADGGVAAFLDSPDQGASGIPISELSLEEDRLELVVPAAQASFTATLSAGEMAGTWAQGNGTSPLTLVRGEYTPPVVALDLTDETMQRLAGTWQGTWVGGEAPRRNFTIRFEETDDGERLGFFDLPEQGVSGTAISEVTLDGDQLTLSITALGATMTGTLTGDELEGQWQQGPTNNPVTLVRDP